MQEISSLRQFARAYRELKKAGWQAIFDRLEGALLKPPGGRKFNYSPFTAVCRHLTGQRFDWDECEKAQKVLGTPDHVYDTILQCSYTSEYWSTEESYRRWLQKLIMSTFGYNDNERHMLHLAGRCP